MRRWNLAARASATFITLAFAVPAAAIPTAAMGSGCTDVAGTTITQCGFEMPSLGNGNFSYGTTGSAWNFSPFSGISSNHSGFTDSQSAPEGVQVAFIQGPSSFSESIDGF